MPNYKKYNTLRDYALWYYFRYYPSNNRLISKLLEKSNDKILSMKIYNNIKHLTNEKEVLQTRIHTYLIRNKNINYIKTKLFEGQFDKDIYEKLLDDIFLSYNKSLLNKDFLYREITRLKNKNKSINYIKNKLIDNNNDKEIVSQVIDSVFIDGENNIIINEIDKLSIKYDNNKIIQKLLQKGFNYSDIKNNLK